MEGVRIRRLGAVLPSRHRFAQDLPTVSISRANFLTSAAVILVVRLPSASMLLPLPRP